MKTPNLDNEINKLEVYKSNDILSEQGEDLLKEFKEIKAKINYTQCCTELCEVCNSDQVFETEGGYTADCPRCN